jgi:hypothetical protein
MTSTPTENQRHKIVRFRFSPSIEDTPPRKPRPQTRVSQVRPVPQKLQVQRSLFDDAPTTTVVPSKATTPIRKNNNVFASASAVTAVASVAPVTAIVPPVIAPVSVITVGECEKVLHFFQSFHDELFKKQQYERAEDVAIMLDVMEVNLEAHKATSASAKHGKVTPSIKLFHECAKLLEKEVK